MTEELLVAASEKAETVRRAVTDWWRAKNEDEVYPGRIYGHRLVMACWELHEVVERIQKESPEHRKEIGQLLREYRNALGTVDRDGLFFGARAIWHRGDAIAGGQTAKYFGGHPVESSTGTIQRMDLPGWQEMNEESPNWHAAYVVDDVTITLTGLNPDRKIVIAADAAHEAASHLVDALGDLLDEPYN